MTKICFIKEMDSKNVPVQNNQFWLYGVIIIAGIVEACGPPMNAALYKTLGNPWSAGLICFIPVILLLFFAFFIGGATLPTMAQLAKIPWWGFLGGVACCIAIVLTFVCVEKVGVGTFAGLIITANLIMSIVIDKYGWFGTEVHPLSTGRIIGGLLMVAGIYLVSKF